MNTFETTTASWVLEMLRRLGLELVELGALDEPVAERRSETVDERLEDPPPRLAGLVRANDARPDLDGLAKRAMEITAVPPRPRA